MATEDTLFQEQTDDELLTTFERFLPEHGSVLKVHALRAVAEIAKGALARSSHTHSEPSGVSQA